MTKASDFFRNAEHFDIKRLDEYRAKDRHLFGFTAHVFCWLLAQVEAEDKPKKLMERVLGSKAPEIPEERALIRWVDGVSDTPPDFPRYKNLARVAQNAPALNRVLHTALHPDAIWQVDAARRVGMFLHYACDPNLVAILDVTETQAAEALLRRANGFAGHYSRSVDASPHLFLGLTLKRTAQLMDISEREAVQTLIWRDPKPRYYHRDHFIAYADLPGFEDAFHVHASALNDAMQVSGFQPETLKYAQKLGILEPFATSIFRKAASTKVSDRRAAEPFIEAYPASGLKAAVEAIASDISTAQRTALYESLGALRGEDVAPHFKLWLESETAAKPKAALEATIARFKLVATADQPDDATGYLAIDGERITLPQVPPLEEVPPPNESAFDLLRDAVESYNKGVDAYNAAEITRAAESGKRWGRTVEPKLKDPLGPRNIAETRKVMEGQPRTRISEDGGFVREAHWQLAQALRYSFDRVDFDSALLTEFLDQPALHWQHIARLELWNQNKHFAESLERATAEDKFTPNGAMWRRILGGVHILEIMQAVPNALPADQGYSSHVPWEDYGYDDIWMAFVPQLDDIISWLSSSERAPKRSHMASPVVQSMKTLAQLPKLPMRAIPDLMRLAMGPEKRWRTAAQNLLANAEQTTPMIVEALSDGKVDTRAEAASWLGRRGDASVNPALEARLKKEKTEAGRAALMTALRALGGDLKPWLNTKSLQAEAEKASKKLKLDAVDWLLPGLPDDLVWADGTPLSREILHYWIALAVKLKQPGGNGLFALWLEELSHNSAAQLGQYLVTAWLSRDVQPMPEREARAKAVAELPTYRRATYLLPEALRQGSDDEVISWLVDKYLRTELVGASDSKGILGLGIRGNGAECAAAARAYLKKHGERVSQAKAVVECMAANPHPACIQVIIGVAERFRQKSVQKLAQELVERIADDHGWSADELADRTIPTGGFDRSGKLELDAGRDRIFTAQLGFDATITLVNPDGKTVKALPAPSGSEEDIALGKDARKSLSAAKKEIKQVTEQFSLRLFEAMCLERVWPRQDWQDHLQMHPLAGLLCQRLVWLGLDDSGAITAQFRPLEDGSLTDIDDGEVDPQGFSGVRLIHGGLLDAQGRLAWKEHLADYEIAPLFDQLIDPVPVTDAEAQETEIADRVGWILDSFALRGQAKKHGYERGPILDGGGFDSYVKIFRNAGLMVELSFSGSLVPEESFDVALLQARVRKMRGDRHGPALTLGAIPPALLTSIRTDLIKISSVGSGFNENYKQFGY